MRAGFGQRRLQRGEFAWLRLAGGCGVEGLAEFGGVVGKRSEVLGPNARGFVAAADIAGAAKTELIDSSSGNESAMPAPRRKLRREMTRRVET